MASDIIVGVYWDNNGLYAVSSDDGQIQNIFSIPMQLQSEDGTVELDAYIERGAIAIKDLFKKQDLSDKDVCLSLPTKDIIFRTFTIPQIPSSEIKGAIDFEVTKYIPFALDEISYAYHTVQVDDNDVKRLKVVFVGIRKATLQRYTATLQKGGAKIISIEPASVSVIRVLHYKGIVQDQENVVIIEYEDASGRITVIHDGVPYFIREFQLMNLDANSEAVDAADPKRRLMNEIQISLDYFNRQDPGIEIPKIVLISKEVQEDLISALEEFLGKPVSGYECQALLDYTEALSIPFFNAFGASLIADNELPFHLSFLGDKKKSIKKKKKKKKKEKSALIKPVSGVKSIILTVIISVILTVTIYFLGAKNKADLERKIVHLTIELDEFIDIPQETIETQNTQMNAKLAAFKKERIKSELHPILKVLPGLLPKGTWFKDVLLRYKSKEEKKQKRRRRKEQDSLTELSLKGYAYMENTNEQFQTISQFLNNLRESEHIGELHKDINLKTTSTQKIEEYDVTYFEIECR